MEEPGSSSAVWRGCVLAAALSASAPAFAGAVYRCIAGGRVIFQQTPCPATSSQQVLSIEAPEPADAPPQAVSCDDPPQPGQRILRIVGSRAVAQSSAIVGDGSATAAGADRCIVLSESGALGASSTTRLAPAAAGRPAGVAGPDLRPGAPPPKVELPVDEAGLIALLPAGFPQGEQAARELGKRVSIPGLQAVMQRRDAELLRHYGYGYSSVVTLKFGDDRDPLPANIEKIVVQNMEDPVLGKPLLMMAHSQRYQTRGMFDALMKHIADKGKVDANTRWPALVVNTNLPGIEAPLLDAVPKLDNDGQMAVLRFLADPRRYNPAVPAIARWAAQAEPAYVGEAYRWLRKIGTPEASNALVERLSAYVPPLTDATRRGELALLNELGQLPRGSVKGLATKVPHKDDADIARAYVGLLQAQPDPGAAKELLGYLDQEKLRQPALEAILATDSMELWQSARDKYMALSSSISPGSYQFAMGQLNRRIDRPDEFHQQQGEMLRNASYSQEREALLKPYYRLGRMRREDPVQYVKLAREKIAAMEQLAARHAGERAVTGLRGDIQQDRAALAATQRFTLRQPQEAITTLQGADADFAGGTALIWIADTYRFDLGDKARAIEHYRKALAAIDEGARKDPQSQGIGTWMRRWIGHEITYLESGKAFAGPVEREDMGGMVLMMIGIGAVDLPAAAAWIGGGIPPDGKPPEQALREALAAVESLPPSQAQLGLVLQLAPAFANGEALVSYLERRDPARYVSAGLLASAEMMRAQGSRGAELAAVGPALTTATAAFMKRTGIKMKTAVDPQFASPEATWRAYLAATRRGDRAAALACFTPGQLKSSLQGLFGRMSNEELKKMADDFSDITPSDERTARPDDVFREYGVVRKSGRQFGFITFVNAGGEWLIQSM